MTSQILHGIARASLAPASYQIAGDMPATMVDGDVSVSGRRPTRDRIGSAYSEAVRAQRGRNPRSTRPARGRKRTGRRDWGGFSLGRGTPNYDRLFEDAVEGLRGSLAVLPYAPSRETQRWLLKMHGSIDHEEDIVLTRRSYNRYAERNQALSGIVQAMLITKRMLFLGFSHSDDNFLRIVDAVRSAVSPGLDSAHAGLILGTAVMLKRNPVLEHHWATDLELCSPSPSTRGSGMRWTPKRNCLRSHLGSSRHKLRRAQSRVRSMNRRWESGSANELIGAEILR